MKKYITILTLLIMFFGSFYITNRIAIYIKDKNPLMQEIKSFKDEYYVEPVNAVTDDTYIIPGLIGSEIDIDKSFVKMKRLKEFNPEYLSFSKINPNISISKEKNKIIKIGNSKKRMVSIIVNNDAIKSYSCKKNYMFHELINMDNYNMHCLIPINNDFGNYQYVEKLLKHDDISSDYCLLNKTNKELCIKENKYLIEPTITLTGSNISMVRKSIKPGYIIYIDETCSINDFLLIINEIKSADLTITSLQEHLSEENILLFE